MTSNQQPKCLVALVENKSGVLNRIASLFRRRRFNIESLTVGHSEKDGLSRMTIVVDELTNVDQVFRQMYKIIEVIKIKKLNENKSVVRDLALVKIKLTSKTHDKILDYLQKIESKVLVKNSKHLVVEICRHPKELDQCLATLKEFGILELSHTGATAISI